MMGRKLNTLSGGDDEKLSDAILASAQQIWQAGLGAFSVAEHEGGKLFSKLVKDGIDIQNRTRNFADVKVSGVADSVTKMAENINRQATGSWDKIEQVFEDRITRTLTQLGVPTSKELHHLAQRVEELSTHIAKLTQSQTGATAVARKTPKKKVAAVKPAPTPAVRKSVAKLASSKMTQRSVVAKKAMTKSAAGKEKPSAK